MQLFFVNTDAASYGGESSHGEWIRRSVVVTSGKAKYRSALARIPSKARVLVYVSGVGIVAVGQMASSEIIDVTPPNTVNASEPIEYHRAVAWLLDLRSKPIARDELMELVGQGPLHAVQEVRSGKEALLARLAILESEPTSNTETYLRVASELRKYGPVGRPTGVERPRQLVAQSTQYVRDPKVRAWTIQRAEGNCELCNKPAPFLDSYQDPYLESHHINTLASDGADTPINTAAVCANCHRELHYGVDRVAKTLILSASIAAKEANNHA